MVAYFKCKLETGTEKVYIYIVCIPKWIRDCIGSHWSNAALYSTRSTLEKSYSSPGCCDALLHALSGACTAPHMSLLNTITLPHLN